MKTILFLTLLVTGLTGNVVVFGQTQRPQLDSALHFSPPVLKPGQTLVVPGPSKPALLFAPFPEQKQKTSPVELFSVDRVIAMEPDHMPCVVSKLSRLEQMPTKKLNDVLVEPMPNFIQKDPVIKVIPSKRAVWKHRPAKV